MALAIKNLFNGLITAAAPSNYQTLLQVTTKSYLVTRITLWNIDLTSSQTVNLFAYGGKDTLSSNNPFTCRIGPKDITIPPNGRITLDYEICLGQFQDNVITTARGDELRANAGTINKINAVVSGFERDF